MFRFRLPRLPKTGNCPGFSIIELLVVLAIIAVLTALLLPVFLGARDNGAGIGETAVITVNHRERATQGYGEDISSKYLIFTDQGEVFEDTDNLFFGKFNSSDLYGQLREGHTYRVRVFGYRSPALSAYRNILSIEGELTPGGQPDGS